MANQPYLTDPSQAPMQVATLGAADTPMDGGQLTTVPAASSDQNWYFNFIAPTYLDYYDWTPDSNGEGGTSNGGAPPTPIISVLPASGSVAPTACQCPAPSNTTPAPSAGAAPAPVGGPSSATPAASDPSSAPATAGVSPVTVVINVPGATGTSTAPSAAAAASSALDGSAASANGGTSPDLLATTASAPSPSPVTSAQRSAPLAANVPQPTGSTIPPQATSAPGTPSNAPASTSTPPSSVASAGAPALTRETHLIGQPIVPDPIVTATTYNPRFRESKARAGHDSVLADLLDEENVTVRMVTRDASPLPFAVPAGCDSVDFSYGPLEVNPVAGSDEDLDLLIALGAPQIEHDGQIDDGSAVGTLAPGSAVLVTIPWRAPSFVTLGANHLKATVYAHFYARMQSFTDGQDD